MLSLVGLHMSRNGIESWPGRVSLALDGNGRLSEHEQAILIYRTSTVYDERPDDLYRNPAGPTMPFAEYWYSGRTDGPTLREKFLANPADYHQITNEASGNDPAEYQTLIAFERNILELMSEDGLKGVIGSLANDTPGSFEDWRQHYLPFIVEAWEQYGAIYGRHVYGFGDLINDQGQPIGGGPARFIAELEALEAAGYGGGVVVTELGIDGGYGVVNYDRFAYQALGYTALLEPFAGILIGVCWWELGETGFEANYTDHLRQLLPALNTSFDPWQPGQPNPGNKPKIVIMVKPPIAVLSEEDNQAAGLYAFNNYGRTTTHSLDDLFSMLAAGNADSYAIIAWPARQPATVAAVEAAGYAWQPWPETAVSGFTHWPTDFYFITQHICNYNPDLYPILLYHEGIDIRAPQGSPIYTPAAGVVTWVSNRRQSDGQLSAYGWHVKIDHGWGSSLLAHLQPNPPASVGQQLTGGQLIGLSGNTGNSTGPHLHLTLKTPEGGAGCPLPPAYADPWPLLEPLYNNPPAPPAPLVSGWLWTNGGSRLEVAANGRAIVTSLGNMRSQPSQAGQLIRSVAAGEIVTPDGRIQNGYSWVTAAANGAIQPGTGEFYDIDFLRADPAAWRVIRRHDGSGEDVFDVATPDGFVRVKNLTEGEFYSADGRVRWLDTSPANDSQGNERVYRLRTGGQPGGTIAPARAELGRRYEFPNWTQFYAKDDCRELVENSGPAISTFELTAVIDNFTFETTGFSVDRLYVTIQTGEVQLYAEKYGIALGWVGGGANQANNVWAGELAELYFDRQIPQEEPPRYC